MGLTLEGAPTLSGKQIVNELKSCGITHTVQLADIMCNFILEEMNNQLDFQVVKVCREGEAVPVAAGLWVGGKEPIIMIQDSGFLESGDSVIQVGIDLHIPLLMFIGYRGFRHNRSEMDDPAGIYLEPTLKAWDIKYETIASGNDISKISDLHKAARETMMPTAALIAWELKW